MSKIFTQYELLQAFKLPNAILPTKTDCLLYVLSRTIKIIGKRDTVVLEMSRKTEDIWNKADCCPFTFKHITELFERGIWQKYLCLKREKRSNKKVNVI